MKELYTSPEMNIMSFAPAENLANGSVNFDDLMNGMNTTVISGGDDVDVDIKITLG